MGLRAPLRSVSLSKSFLLASTHLFEDPLFTDRSGQYYCIALANQVQHLCAQSIFGEHLAFQRALSTVVGSKILSSLLLQANGAAVYSFASTGI